MQGYVRFDQDGPLGSAMRDGDGQIERAMDRKILARTYREFLNKRDQLSRSKSIVTSRRVILVGIAGWLRRDSP